MNHLTVTQCNAMWDRQYGEKKESCLTLVKWSQQIPTAWVQKKLNVRNRLYSYDYMLDPKKVVNEIRQEIVGLVNGQKNNFLFLGEEQLLIIEIIKDMQHSKEINQRVNLLEFVYVEDVFYPEWDENSQSYTDEGEIIKEHIFSFINNINKGYLESPCHFDRDICSMKSQLNASRINKFKNAIYETSIKQCYSCEKHKPNCSLVGLQFGYYCFQCVDEAMVNVPTGGIVNYMYFHFMDQDFLDMNINWLQVEKGKKNKRNLKKKKERLKKELNKFKV